MSEIEVPIEQSQEHILEKAHHEPEVWFSWVALSSAILAVLAAIAALLAGHHSNDALLNQIQSSDHWAFYQAKGIKAAVLNSKMETLRELGKTDTADDAGKLEQYKKEQEEIAKQAEEKEQESKANLLKHETLAQAVTFFQIAIAISAISVLIRKRRFWLVSLCFGACGVFFLAKGILFL